MSVKEQIKKLARKQCAGHTEYGECLYYPDGETSCRLFRDGFIGHTRCSYFEHFCLPGSPIIEAQFWRELTGYHPEAQNMATCSCGTKFIKRSNRHKFCDGCSAMRKRDSNRESMRKTRSSVGI